MRDKDVIFQMLEPGQRLSTPHNHSYVVEAVYVLQGILSVWQAGLEETIEAQSFVRNCCFSGDDKMRRFNFN